MKGQTLSDCSVPTGEIRGPLQCTGERMVPELTGASTFWAHVRRYQFATRFVKGRRVLDVASGEGYGAYALQLAGASQVVGVDVSESVCQHASAKYGLDVRCSDATALPLDDQSIDVIVSFETIEHIPQPSDFLAECLRVLKGDGLLVISTPDRDVYSENGHHNEFHCSEMSKTEFTAFLTQYFQTVTMFSQVIQSAPWWNLASLTAINSPWCRVRGFYRLRRRLLRLAASDIEECRQHPERAILASEGFLTRLFDPNHVRSVPASNAERAKYYVAVCRTKRDPITFFGRQ